MSIWKPELVHIDPQVVLSFWRVFELPSGHRHLCGFNTRLGEGRVSSCIVEWHPDTLTGVTRSGRIYQLQGPPGDHSDAWYVWQKWCVINKITHAEDVSNQVWDSRVTE